MHVAELDIRFLRIITHAHLSLHPRTNLVVGANASGKTTLLEALWTLSALNSFRSRRAEELVQRGQPGYRVSATVHQDAAERQLQVERRRGETSVLLDGDRLQRASELARVAPMVLLEPDSQRLVSGGPRERRRLLDWALFHVKHDYLASWRAFHDALKQRNAALRVGGSALKAWNSVVAQRGMAIDNARRACAQALESALCSTLPKILPEQVVIRYEPGWPADRQYEEVLEEGAAADRDMGFTRLGPHKAEIAFTVGGKPAHRVLSRGQTKCLAVCLMLAQASYISASTGQHPVLLVDDLASELDRPTRQGLLALIKAEPGQAIFTALDEADLGLEQAQLFHVEQGRLEEKETQL